MDRVAAAIPDPDSAADTGGRAGLPPIGLGAILVAVLVAPLVVALAALSAPRWYPILDMAQTEVRIRDVWSSRPPLIGLAGRLGPFGPDGGSHPGPLSFYALWPVWRLTGGRAYGLFAGQVVLDAIAFGLAGWLGYRRAGRAGLLGTALLLGILTRAYGAFLLTLPWNPYLPVLWWVVFLLAAWSVVDDDPVAIPVAVGAGSFCAQTHIPYLGLVGGGVVALGVLLAVRMVRSPDRRRATVPWLIGGVLLGAVLWAPPVVDQLTRDPGNLATIRDHFSHPPEAPIGIGPGARAFLGQLDPIDLVSRTLVRDERRVPATGSPLPGLVLVGVWLAVAVRSVRAGPRLLARLNAVIGGALILGFVSAARIFGEVFYYLLLWAWALAAAMLAALVWSIGSEVRHRVRDAARFDRVAVGAAVVVLVANAVVFSVGAARIDVQSERLNASLAALAPATADALAARERGGAGGPYVVTWLPDPQAIGSAGFGLLDELDREGFDVRAAVVFRPGATRNHVIEPADAALEVHLATGESEIARRRADRSWREVAAFDPRRPSERSEFARLRRELLAILAASELSDRTTQVDDNLFMLGLVDDLPPGAQERIDRMLEIGVPSAVFLGRPEAAR